MCKQFTCSFVEIDVNTFKLQVWIAVVSACRVNSMFIWDHFPELSTRHAQLNDTYIHVNDFQLKLRCQLPINFLSQLIPKLNILFKHIKN